MAKPIEIIIKVRDAASDPIDRVGKKVKNLSSDFTKFNRILFATTAFTLTFSRAFSAFFDSMERGAEIDRVSDQFERVLGPKGTLFDNIKKFTDSSIDRFAAMKAGIELKAFGIVQSADQVAELTSRAGVAAKLAGKQSGEGIEAFSSFLKDGSISHLEFLNLISRTNPALQAELSVLRHSTGVMGEVISTQEKLTIGKRLLYLATKDNMKGNRDLLDTILDIKQSFMFLKAEVGTFLGKAIQPLLEKIIELADKFTTNLEHIRKTNKNLLFLAKAFIITTSAVAALVVTLGTLRLTFMALGALGFGMPRLIFLATALSAGFLGITNSADSMMKRLEVFGGFLKGIAELVNTFFDPENFAKGIGLMDKSVHDMLQRAGLLTLVENISRVIIVIKTFVNDTIFFFAKLGTFIDNIFGGIASRIIKALDIFKKPWSRFWIEENPTLMNRAKRWIIIATSIGAAFAALKFIPRIFSGIFSKIPIIGKLFGGGMGGSAPRGTPNDPIYVKPVAGGLLGGLGAGLGTGLVSGGILSTIKTLVLSLLPMILPMMGYFLAGYAATAVGFNIGNQLNKFDNATGGHVGNFLQGAMDKTSRLFGGTGIMTNEEAFAEADKKRKGEPVKSSSIIPPSESNERRFDTLTNMMQEMDSDNAAKMASIIHKAQMTHSGKGNDIDKSDYEDIFSKMAHILGQIRTNTDPSKNKPSENQTRR